MSRLLCTLVLLSCCCAPLMVDASLWSRAKEKFKEAVRPERNATSVYQLLEDLYYLDEAVAELAQMFMWGATIVGIVLCALLIVPIWIMLYRIHGARREMQLLREELKKRQ